MAEPGFVQITSRDGYPMRELVLGQTTRVGIQCELDGATGITLSAVTFELARGATSKQYTSGGGTVTIDGNAATVDVSNADLVTTLGASELETLTGAWTVTLSGHPNTEFFEESFFVARKRILCPMLTVNFLARHPELQHTNAYPIDPATGRKQTNWLPQIRIAWAAVRHDFAGQGDEKGPWMIVNCNVLEPLMQAKLDQVIGNMNLSGLNGELWAKVVARAEKEYARLWSGIHARYAEGSRTALGKEPSIERRPIQDPPMLTGDPRDVDFGKW